MLFRTHRLMSLRAFVSVLILALVGWTALPADAQVVCYRRPAPRRVVVVQPAPRPIYYRPVPVAMAPSVPVVAPAPVVVVQRRPVVVRPRPVVVVNGPRRYYRYY